MAPRNAEYFSIPAKQHNTEEFVIPSNARNLLLPATVTTLDTTIVWPRSKARARRESSITNPAHTARIDTRMKLQINGEARDFTDAAASFTLAALVEALGMKPDRVAVELNRNIVPRDRWSATQLTEGDQLEVVHFVGGGTLS